MKQSIKTLLMVMLSVFLLSSCTYPGSDDLLENDTNDNDIKPGEKSVIGEKAGSTSVDPLYPVEEFIPLNTDGSTIRERFNIPDGFKRISTDNNSFEEYLTNLSLKPHGSAVHLYNGDQKLVSTHQAVVDMDIGERDLQQCADAVIRLRAEYLYALGDYERIHFNFTNGFKADYMRWREGQRISVNGNNVVWVNRTTLSDTYEDFREYLNMVFAYAGTMSLSQELEKVAVEDMKIGDVFIQGGSPGHCVIVVDMAENLDTGEKMFIIAQSYMPAQDIHILKNPADSKFSPWYNVDFGDTLNTPDWTFLRDDMKRFQ